MDREKMKKLRGMYDEMGKLLADCCEPEGEESGKQEDSDTFEDKDAFDGGQDFDAAMSPTIKAEGSKEPGKKKASVSMLGAMLGAAMKKRGG